jgi:lysophospholipase L1-like esterase
MKIFQLLVISVATVAGCNKKTNLAPQVPTDTVKTKNVVTDSITYLALGDSYTVGQAEPQSQSFPFQLVDSLNARSFAVEKPNVIAVTGWTTDDLINGIASAGISGKKFGFVTLLIGVNDQYQQLSIDNYKQKFMQVLNQAIAFAGGDKNRVFVLSIPDWGVTPFADGQDSVIYPQIMAFNAVNQSITQSMGISYINITDVSRTAGKDASLIAPDGLHFSGRMYAMWVALLAPAVAANLKR